MSLFSFKTKVWIATAFLFMLCFNIAFTQRGCFAIGGEWLIWLLPFFVKVAISIRKW